jgi:hypothetical protein
MKPNATHYLSTYPVAVKLWREGKHQEAVAAFVKSPSNLIIKGENKAEHYANARQESMRQTKAASLHEAITDAMCKGYTVIWHNFPKDCSLPQLVNLPEINALSEAIRVRREEWQKLYGIHAKARRARVNAIRLKAFVRIMRLMDKQA